MSNKSKKLSKTAWLYVFIALFITVLSFFSATLAWYIKTQTKSLGITFANPVVVEVNNKASVVNAINGGNVGALKPGSKVSINTGIKLAENSSNAYVRAKITLVAEDIYDENGNLQRWDNYVTISGGSIAGGVTPIASSWQEILFEENGKIEKWYVVKSQDGVARELVAGDPVAFYDGEVVISRKMDNRFANKSIEIQFVVESIQAEGVVDPIACGQWGKLK